MKKLQEYVEELNSNIEKIDARGPVSKYVLPDENLQGRCVLSFSDNFTSERAYDLWLTISVFVIYFAET